MSKVFSNKLFRNYKDKLVAELQHLDDSALVRDKKESPQSQCWFVSVSVCPGTCPHASERIS